MSPEQLQARVVRRELHSSKAALAVVLAVVAVVALAWVGTESVLAALGRPALLLSPDAVASDVRQLSSVPAPLLIAIGAVVAVVGLILAIAALTPGRRGRHVIGTGSPAPIVVNDEVVGSALVRVACEQAGISPDRAVASVGRRSASVKITPVSGVQIDRDAVRAAAAQAVEGFGLTPPVRVSVSIDRRGKVGG